MDKLIQFVDVWPSEMIGLKNCELNKNFSTWYNNISENLSKMDEVIASLSIQDMLELDAYMEENFEKLNKKYLII